MSCSNRLLSTATAHFLSAVITDDFQNCGNHPDSLQTWLMPDIIGDDSIKADDSMYGKSAWCTIEIPQNIKADSYKLNLLLQQDGKTVSTIPFTKKYSIASSPSLKTSISTSGNNPMLRADTTV